MKLRRSSLVGFATVVVLALIVAATPAAEASRESAGPLDHLGIQRFSCRCSQTRVTEFDFAALEAASPTTIGEAARAMGKSAGELLRSLARRISPGPGDEAAADFFGMREPAMPDKRTEGEGSISTVTNRASNCSDVLRTNSGQ